MSSDLPDLLRHISFFRALSAGALEAVAERVVRRSVPKGFTLFRAGEPCRGVYLLVKGEVEIYRSTSDGREQVIHVETPVQSIAELPLFDGGAYPASARARQACELHFLSLADFQRLYRESPEIADALIRSLGGRLRTLVKLVEKISLKTVPARVAATLVELAEREGQLRAGGTFELSRTHEELAHQLATSRESVARALGGFRKKAWIRQEGRTVTLLAVRELEREAEGEHRDVPGRR
jgi:CRP/FNR family transcriptional regulator